MVLNPTFCLFNSLSFNIVSTEIFYFSPPCIIVMIIENLRPSENNRRHKCMCILLSLSKQRLQINQKSSVCIISEYMLYTMCA